MAKTMKSLLSVFLAVLMVCSLMVVPSSAAKVSLNKTSVTVTKGYQTTLKVSGTSSTVKWSTGDKSVATVSSKGKVVGKGVGTTYIYAKVSNTTLKCKVKVVAAKITASTSNVMLEKGETKTVTMTVKGSHSGLTVGSTNKKVATASWVKPVEWDGDKIKLKINATGDGDARIKVYLKKYPSTCYKYINVTVGDPDVVEEDIGNDENTSNITIAAYTQNVNLSLNETYTLQLYCTDFSNLAYQFYDSTIASATQNSIAGNYRNYVIKGLKAGTTVLRFYNKNNVKNYIDVKVTVGSTDYYAISETRPAVTIAATDKVLTIQAGSKNYYILVPEKYDPAYVYTLVAKKFNQFAYYTVYDTVPNKLETTDQIKEFVNKNATYVNPNYSSIYYNNTLNTKRYVLLPEKTDDVQYNTVVAQYNNAFEPWTIYNIQPTINNSLTEILETWTVVQEGKIIRRYMLVPYAEWDQAKIDKIKDIDINGSNASSYYQIYDEYPEINPTADSIVMFTKLGKRRYMVVPATDVDILKRNDAIQADTGVYEPYVMYSTSPIAIKSKGEYVLSMQYGNQTIYVLCTYEQGTEKHTEKWAKIDTNAPKGT